MRGRLPPWREDGMICVKVEFLSLQSSNFPRAKIASEKLTKPEVFNGGFALCLVL